MDEGRGAVRGDGTAGAGGRAVRGGRTAMSGVVAARASAPGSSVSARGRFRAPAVGWATAVALMALTAAPAVAAPAQPSAPGRGHSAVAADPVGLPDTRGTTGAGSAARADGGTYAADTSTAGTTTSFRFRLDGARGGAVKLSRAQLDRIATSLGLPRGSVHPVAGLATRSAVADRPTTVSAARGPATLRCDKNPSWSDANGTLAARFNCHYSTINWGYRISARVRSLITGNVHESGVSWWRNGRRMPKNAGHVVGSAYHFHGTLKPVHHGDHVQFQDYMTFRVRVGGRPGTGSLAWAADVKAKK